MRLQKAIADEISSHNIENADMSFCLFPHILLRCLLDEKGLAAVPELHVQVHRLPIDFYVNLQENRIDESSSSSSAEVTGSTCLQQSLWGEKKSVPKI